MATIKPLPEAAADQVKASVLITSLQGVIIGLIENSLDSDATKIDVKLDLEKGFCVIEDDGCGIAAADFAESGGLGKIHHTSKHPSSADQHGKRGIFIWAVSSLSTLTISSRQKSYGSTCSLTFHHGKVLSRQLQLLSTSGLCSPIQGTRVEVRDLFGNMPVRVMQRPRGPDGARQRDREWRHLAKSISGVLLAWGKAIDFTLDGSDRNHRFRIRNVERLMSLRSHNEDQTHLDGRFQLPILKNILVHGASADPLRWNSWVQSSARTKNWIVRAIISLDPSGSKDIQFLSFGIRYIGTTDRLYWLYDEVNRLFERSSFALQDDPAIAVDGNLERKDRLRIFRSPARKQLKGKGKGIERWPMFFIRIDRDATAVARREPDSPNSAEGSALIPIIHALIERFLTQNNMRLWRQRLNLPFTASNRAETASEQSPKAYTLCERRQRTENASLAPIGTEVFFSQVALPSAQAEKEKVKRPWVKAGPSTLSSLQAPGSPGTATLHSQDEVETRSVAVRGNDTIKGTVGDDLPESYLESAINKVASDDLHIANSSSARGDLDSAAREATGSPLDISRSSYFPSHPGSADAVKLSCGLFDMARTTEKTPWASTLLESWKNPVFEVTEKPIPQVSDEAYNRLGASINDLSSAPLTDAVANPIGLSGSRLKRSDLACAKVIAQVDAKFILITVLASPIDSGRTDGYTAGPILVLVDQHAADERVQVENLLEELCSPVADRLKDFRSPLGQQSPVNMVLLSPVIGFDLRQHECHLFNEHAGHFARWGILYAVRHSGERTCASDSEHSMFVLSLPPVISERCRAEPKLLSELLRREVWALQREERRSRRQVSSEAAQKREISVWTQIQDCPEGILDMVNSRACRSAIMFNDQLSLQECKELIRKLATCHLPFQCAHGRPSMVPLASLEALSRHDDIATSHIGQTFGNSHFSNKTLRSAWKNWESTMHT